MEMIDTRIYDDTFLLAKIFENTELNKDEKERLYKHFEKRKEGQWIHERLSSTTGGSYPVVRCSICSGTIPFDWETRFCPHCGNGMRRGEDG